MIPTHQPSARASARAKPPAPLRVVAVVLASLALTSARVAAETSDEPFETAAGQIAAQTTATMVGFLDRAAEVVVGGGDTLRLPQGEGAFTRLTRQLSVRRLVTAGEAAFHGEGYHRLVVTGVDIADRALRLAGRPTGLRLHGSSRLIRGTAAAGGGFAGRGVTLGLSGARALSDDLVAGFAVGVDEGDVSMRGGDSGLFNRGWMAAAQFGWRPHSDTTLSVTAGTGIASRDISHHDGALQAAAEARRDFVTLHAEHAFTAAGFRLTPSSVLHFTTESGEAYTDSAGVRFDDEVMNYGRLTGGIELGYGFDLEHGAVDLYASVQADWDFMHPDQVTLTTGRWSDDLAAGGRAASGITLRSDAGFTSNVEVSNNVIGPGGLNDTRLRGSVGFGF